MKTLLLISFSMLTTLSLNNQAVADPDTQPKAWSADSWHQQMRLMPKGDLYRGAQLAKQGYCFTCHGEKGYAPSRNAPSLAGQNQAYLYKTLLDFKNRLWLADHKDEGMHDLARTFDKQDLADLAAYYAAQKPWPKITPSGSPAIAHLAKRGDPQRLLTPCASCHGAQGMGGPNETPRINGQSYLYLKRQLSYFKSGKRSNDVEAGMRFAAEVLSEEEIDQLARYYANSQK
ncbi:MAG TPA: c-type cytochrome [Piscirickettsiaceae bacterium]|nr:c-type cytochrome [Piscirickettsiaceae bacterium]HIQ40297.1 c-type cytochrome [Sulfurivirga caldicuralii]